MEFRVDIEHLIKNSPQLYFKLSTGKKSIDFCVGEVVKCTYLKGFYRISEVFKDTIEISPLEYTNEFFKVDPTFLEKTDVNLTSVKILYGKKLT